MVGEVEGAIGDLKHSSLDHWEWAILSASYHLPNSFSGV
jgi:hypothetical protein